MASGGAHANGPDVEIRVDNASTHEDLDAENGVTTSGVNNGRTTPRIGVKLKMPSKQLTAVTKAFNRLVEFTKQHPKATAEEVAPGVAELEQAMGVVWEELDRVKPVDEAQRMFKEQWAQKNLVGKESFIRDLMQSKQREARSVVSRRASSKSSRALNEARAREAVLRLKKRQLEERQEMELQLETARIEREVLEQELGSDEEEDHQEPLPLLERQTQLNEEWLQASHGAIHHGVSDGAGMERDVEVEAEPLAAGPIQDQLLQHVLLAQARLPTFKGERLEFPWFMKAFEEQVEKVTTDPRRRLYLLLQQLQGEAHTLVKACQLTPDARRGYRDAKRLLMDKYGNPIQVAQAFKEKLLGWPTVKAAGDLASFCIQLQLCQQVQRNQRGMEELDAASTLLRLASKLPHKLQNSWQNRVVDVEINQHRDVTFDDLVGFVQRAERAKNHPVFGKLEAGRHTGPGEAGRSSKDGPQWAPERGKCAATVECSTAIETAATYSDKSPSEPHTKLQTQRNAWKPPCLFCEGNHAAAKCPRAEEWPKKDRLTKLQGLCFGCLRPGHQARGCKSRLKCGKCSRAHPTVLHDESQPQSSQDTKQQGKAETSKENTALESSEGAKNAATAAARGRPSFAVAVAPVVVREGTLKATTRAVLDSASTSSFVTQRLLAKLGIDATPSTLTVTTMTGTEEVSVGVVQGLRVSDVNENDQLLVHKAYVVNSLPFGEEQSVTAEDVAQWPHLAALPFNFVDAPIDMLLGQDVPGAVAPITAVRGGPEDPYAVLTHFGWCVQGPIAAVEERQAQALVNAVDATEIQEKLDRMYYQDFNLAFNFISKGMSAEDKWWMKQVESSTERCAQTGHYTIALPVRACISSLSNNLAQAEQRLQSLQKQFERRPQLEKDYRAFMTAMIDKNFVEWVENEPKQNREAGGLNYVLHHGVYHPRKPGKLRVVFNCAAKYHGVSLNDCLVPGPDLTNSILGVLIRFRQHEVAFMADVDAMFYQVLVPEDQRNLLRLLWWRNGKVAVYRLRVHLFGAASSPGIANFALRRAAEQALEAKEAEVTATVVDCVRKNFYVDDCLKSVATVGEARDMIKGLKAACAYGGFNLSKFLANDARVLSAVKKEEWSKAVPPSIKDDGGVASGDIRIEDKHDTLAGVQERALGVAWNVASDCFVFRIVKPDTSPQGTTKRAVLSGLSKLYDPIGAAAPVIIKARVLFRTITRDKTILSWDDPLPESYQRSWLLWLEGLQDLEAVKLPRCYTSRDTQEPEEEYQLHAFCDASLEAYAAAVYLRKGHQVAFVLSKARVAPPKVVTVPRLELVVAKLAAELLATVVNEIELPIARRVLWSDSTTVLKYLQSRTKRFPIFVANRVESILHLTEVEEWRYVPTNLNPADGASRGLDPSALLNSPWISGPEFLQREEHDWPRFSSALGDKDGKEGEAIACSTGTTQGEEDNLSFVESIAERQPHAHGFRRAIAIWLRLKNYLRGGVAMRGPFQSQELRNAEKEALKWLQRITWDKELQGAKKTDGVPLTVTRKSMLHKLSPIWHTELVCIGARTRERVPIVPKGNLAQLLVQEAHEQQGHLGRNATAARASREHWIVGLQQITRKVVKNCRRCRFWKTKPAPELMAPLPSFRRQRAEKAFESTGVDFFGPFQVREKSKELTKVYGVLFTCSATRAVHLEMAPDLSSTGFVNALRRFVARRGHVRLMVSDNGTNIDGAEEQLNRELRKELELLQGQPEAVFNEARSKGIEWRFNAPGASHHGGFWERLIRTIKRVLQVTLSRRGRPTTDGFRTVLCEVEAILNNRPLTACSDDPNDFNPLTPNHLVIGCGSGMAPPGQYESMAQNLRHRWKGIQVQAQTFWKRWTHEYLVLLRERSKWHVETQHALKRGDVVLVVDALQPRNYWKLGRIVEVRPSEQDGRVRVVDVKTATGLLTRPISKVCLLEAE